MKKYFFSYGLFLFINIHLQAQIIVNVGAPAWGPTVTTEEYYYLPDIDSYYDIHQSQFIYIDKGTWIRSKSLPSRYRNYNLKKGHVVIVNDYHGPSPYLHYKSHKVKYFGNGNRGRGTGKFPGNRGHGKGNQNKKEK